MFKKTISYIGFWQDYDIYNNPLTNFINKKNEFKILEFNENEQRDITIYGSFFYKDINYKSKKILYISEPIDKTIKWIYNSMVDNKYDIITLY